MRFVVSYRLPSSTNTWRRLKDISTETLWKMKTTDRKPWMLKYPAKNIRKKKILALKAHHHHHHVMLPAGISLTLFRHPSLSSITPERSSRLHPVTAQICCIWVLAGCPTFARPCEGCHWSTYFSSNVPQIWFV